MMKKQWTIYILQCRDGTLYTGITDDLGHRLKAHESGRGAKYTRGRGPFQVRYRETAPDKAAALKREWALKRLRKQEKMTLIREFERKSAESLAFNEIRKYTGNENTDEMSARRGGENQMKKERTLVVLAAGLGSRFAGGVKQLQRVGPSGEVIMDYSIHDAIEAGFNRVIFIIRHDIQELFDSMIGNRIREICAAKGVEVLCAYQEKDNLPGNFVCPGERVKPWGTGHALLSCKGMLHGGFTVVNSDDYYGKDAYRQAMEFLDSLEDDSEGVYGLIGFRLGNTLSEHGGVTRGLCQTENGWLTHILETRNVVKTQTGARAEIRGTMTELQEDIPVSMNMWGFTPDVIDQLEARFLEFLEKSVNEPKSEFLIPTEMEVLRSRGTARIRVLPTTSQWFGMTYAEDMPGVRQAFQDMTADGLYTSPLF